VDIKHKINLSSESTHDYYEHKAEQYFLNTINLDMKFLHKRFLEHVPRGGRILDAGSGSGRDTLAFIQQGFHVEAFDASVKLASMSSNITKNKTKVMTFLDVCEVERYDGIWACASLLHIPSGELANIFNLLKRALKKGGAIYVSFQYGTSERTASDGRYFSDMDEQKLKRIINKESQLLLKEIWRSKGIKHFSKDEVWLNAIAIRQK